MYRVNKTKLSLSGKKMKSGRQCWWIKWKDTHSASSAFRYITKSQTQQFPQTTIRNFSNAGGREKTRYLFDEVDARLQIHTEVNKYPFDTLAFILFLFQHEHVVVEKLLQLFVGEVDAQLFETIELAWWGPRQNNDKSTTRHSTKTC